MELVFHIACREVECGNEWNVSHLQILLIKTLYYELYYYSFDGHSSYKQNRTNLKQEKGLLERIVEPPFSYVIAWSSTLHWV